MTCAEVRGSQRIARAAGALYLVYFAVSVLSEGLGQLTMGDAASIVASATAHPWRFRAAFVAGLGCALVFACAAWALHALLRPVGPRLARLFLVLNVVGVAVQSLSTLNLAAVWLIPREATALGSHDALVRVFVELYRTGYVQAQLFFGAWLLPLGYLVYRSGFLPRALGVLLLADCVAILTWFFQCFLFPGYEVILYPCWAVGFVAELSLTVWLLVRGVRRRGATTTELASPAEGP